MTPDMTRPEWAAQKTYDENRAFSKTKATRPPLTPEEEKRPFAKYYYDEIPQPDPAHYAIMDEPMDPADAFYPEDINRLLDVPALEAGVEIGWCNLPNGAGYIANRIHYPEFTADMVDWWFAWHPLEDLRYRIWYPPQHAGIMLSPIDRARILDDSIPNREKNWGVVHNVTENCDNGYENIDIAFRSPADAGFDMEKFDKVAATMAGGMGWAVTVDKTDESITAPALMVPHVLRRSGGRADPPHALLDGLPLQRGGQARAVPAARRERAGGGRPGPGAPQRQGVHALARVPAAHLRGARPEHVLLGASGSAEDAGAC